MTLKELVDAVETADKAHALAAQAERGASEELERCKAALLKEMQDQGTEITRVDGFTASRVQKERPHVLDWEKFYGYLKRSGNLQLLERRVSSKAFKEVLDMRDGEDLPGVSTYRYEALQTRRG